MQDGQTENDSGITMLAIEKMLRHFPPPAKIATEKLRKFLDEISPPLDRTLHASLTDRRDKAPTFNVFSIIGREHYEVTTHSSFIASLLNPLGEHGQGDLFFRQFRELILALRPHWTIPESDILWRVETERSGIDILLTHRRGPYFIVIENKWFARDREQQTFRYWQKLRPKQASHLAELPVIYLTRYGGEPDFTSEPGEKFRNDLLCLSYRTDIFEMLERCIPKVCAPRVSETLRQYTQILGAIRET